MSFKLVITILLLCGGAVMWLRMQWAIDKNKRAANKIVNGLKDGTYSVESFEESLAMTIRTKKLPATIDITAFQRHLEALTGTKLREKFTVQYATMNGNHKGIVIAKGVVKDLFSAASDKQIDVTYPCWIYIETDKQHEELYFKSSMPDGKDHHYLLEDISDAIYERCVN